MCVHMHTRFHAHAHAYTVAWAPLVSANAQRGHIRVIDSPGAGVPSYSGAGSGLHWREGVLLTAELVSGCICMLVSG